MIQSRRTPARTAIHARRIAYACLFAAPWPLLTACSSNPKTTMTLTAPTITWGTPAAIPVGTALGPAQLNASANIAGTFAYVPATGTSFSAAGPQTLSVTFTPQNAAAYTPATASVPLVVGRTFYVSVNGSDNAAGQTPSSPFRTIQKAADLTAPGDFVYVMNGTYNNDDNNYAIIGISTPGTPNAWITYQAYPGATPVLQGNNYTWSVITVNNTAAYISISGFTVLGNDANVTLAQALANDNDPANHPETNGNCITVNGNVHTGGIYPHHVKIFNNIAGNCPGGGIGSTFADYLTITGNTIYGNSFYSSYGTSGISTLANFDSNPADTTTRYKMVIQNNNLYANEELVPVYNSNPPAITDGEAIIIDSTNNSAYLGSGLTNPPYTGRTLIANNVVFNNGSDAIEVFQSSHVDVVNNSTYANVTNPPLTGRGEMNLNVAADVNIVNNIFYSAPGQNPVVMSNACAIACTLDYNQYYGGGSKLVGIAAGGHDQTGDPLYVLPAASTPAAVNLKLQPASPALATGTSNLAPATDINGIARPATGVDRGAYQQ
jgi:hypothetical protein